MKKLICFLMALLLLTSYGCRAKQEETVSDDQILIVVDIQADDVYLVVFPYTLDGEFTGLRESGHVDGTKMSGKFYIILDKSDFPEDASLQNFSFSIGVSDNVNDSAMSTQHEGRNGSSGFCDPFEIQYGKIYHFEFSGNYEDGFVLKRID